MSRSRQRRSAGVTEAKKPRDGSAELTAAASFLRRQIHGPIRLAVVLGSGYSSILDSLAIERRVPFGAVPGLVSGSVEGHLGAFVAARVADEPVLFLAGRAHVYEGFSAAQVAMPMRILAALGIQVVLLTNAAGGIHPRLSPGSFMILRDHLNFQGDNPLIGVPPDGLPRFPDMTRVYDPEFRGLLRQAAKTAGVSAREGVYLAVTGPSFETPAEIRAFRSLGADAVGMSTVPEAIVARQCGLRVAGLSLITNRAAGLSRGTLTHDEVLARGKAASAAAGRLILEFVRLAMIALRLPCDPVPVQTSGRAS